MSLVLDHLTGVVIPTRASAYVLALMSAAAMEIVLLTRYAPNKKVPIAPSTNAWSVRATLIVKMESFVTAQLGNVR